MSSGIVLRRAGRARRRGATCRSRARRRASRAAARAPRGAVERAEERVELARAADERQQRALLEHPCRDARAPRRPPRRGSARSFPWPRPARRSLVVDRRRASRDTSARRRECRSPARPPASRAAVLTTSPAAMPSPSDGRAPSSDERLAGRRRAIRHLEPSSSPRPSRGSRAPPHGTLWVVLVGDRRAEERHHGVADELLDRAAEALELASRSRSQYGASTARTSSGSSCSARDVKPTRSAKSTVTTFRSSRRSLYGLERCPAGEAEASGVGVLLAAGGARLHPPSLEPVQLRRSAG